MEDRRMLLMCGCLDLGVEGTDFWGVGVVEGQVIMIL